MPRSFRADAMLLLRLRGLRFIISGSEFIPTAGPFLVTINHYASPTLRPWWPVLSISATVPVEIHWTMTSAWTNSGLLSPLSRWLFPKVAALYGFTPMPPMPPTHQEAEDRAAAVRHVLDYAHRSQAPVVGLAPEGRDFPGCLLGSPPPGAGRFIFLLCQYCQNILPAGVYELDGTAHINFGSPYHPELPPGLSPTQKDVHVSNQVMHAIALLLPEHLRGDYG